MILCKSEKHNLKMREVEVYRRRGFKWVEIAERLGAKTATIHQQYYRWKKKKMEQPNGNR